MAIIQALIELRYSDERRTPPNELELAGMAASWNIHFDRAEIPSDELVALYYDTVAEWDGKGFFTPSLMVSFWKKKLKQANLEYAPIPCGVCKGSGIAVYYDWETDKNIEIICMCKN